MPAEHPPPWPPPTDTRHARADDLDLKYAETLCRMAEEYLNSGKNRGYDCYQLSHQELLGERYDSNGDDTIGDEYDHWAEDVLWFLDEFKPDPAPPMIVFGKPDEADDDDDAGIKEEGSGAEAPVTTFASPIRSRIVLAALLERRPPAIFCSGPWKRSLPEAVKRVGAPQFAGHAGTNPLRHCHPPDPNQPSDGSPQLSDGSSNSTHRAGTDLLGHCHPPDPRPPLLQNRNARRIYLPQSADLAPDPLPLPLRNWNGFGPQKVTCPLSADLAPNPGGSVVYF